MSGFSALSALVVDDNRHMRALALSLLRGYGFSALREAEDAASAWALSLQRPADIVLVDFDMPGMGGAALIQRFRRDPASPAPNGAIILMTAFSDRQRVLAARDAGASEIITKPLSIKALLSRIVAVVDHPRQFVRASAYVGPDRRRNNSLNYRGPLRRDSDNVHEIDAPVSGLPRWTP